MCMPWQVCIKQESLFDGVTFELRLKSDNEIPDVSNSEKRIPGKGMKK